MDCIKKTFVYWAILSLLVSAFGLFSSQAFASGQDEGPYPPPPTTIPDNPTYLYKTYLPLTTKYYPPLFYTTSYYLFKTEGLVNLGCTLGAEVALNPGAQDLFVFLDFGKPNRDSYGVYGTVNFHGDPLSITDIYNAVNIFANEFQYCMRMGGDNNSFLTIGVGTNSSGPYLGTIAEEHGNAWRNLVINLNSEFYLSGISNYVIAVGASNIEPSFNSVAITNQWLQGYLDLTAYTLYVIASADGCPLNYPPNDPPEISEHTTYENGDCNDGWTQEDIYLTTWSEGLNFLPEIYETAYEAHARQWYRIGLHANLVQQDRMFFSGHVTQSSVCQQIWDRGETERWQADCYHLNNPPDDASYQLTRWVRYNDTYDRMGDNIIWFTDMEEYGNE